MSMIKFLVDENVERTVIDYLIKKNYDTVIAAKGKLSGREDKFLLNYAFREKRIVITNDKDFGYLIYHQNLPA